MDEWGKYLKNAVANVEQQLDKVLLDNQENAKHQPPTKPGAHSSKSNRPDLAERLRKAAAGDPKSKGSSGTASPRTSEDDRRKSTEGERVEAKSNSKVDILKETSDPVGGNASENASSKPEPPELLTAKEFKSAPEIDGIVSQAKVLALAVERDDALALAEALSKYKTEVNAYVDNVSERMLAYNSKIAYLSHQSAETAQGSEQKIALLLEEGNRLSKRELELNLVLKKLRAERTKALAKGELLAKREKEIDELRKSLEDSRQKLKEADALVEHYRSAAEIEAGSFSSEKRSRNVSGSSESAIGPPSSGVDALERKQQDERQKWHELEAELLSRLAEQEKNLDTKNEVIHQLQLRLQDSQKVATDARDQIAALQDELDAAKESQYALETRFTGEVNNLTTELMILKQQLNEKTEKATNAEELTVETGKQVMPTEESPQTPSDNQDQEGPRLEVSSSPLVTSAGSFAEMDVPFADLDNGPVGHSGPFGVLSSFDAEAPTPNDLSSDPPSEEDIGSIINSSWRESSIMGSESGSGSHPQLVRKLMVTISKLKKELGSARKSAELSQKQRDELQAELADTIDAQDRLKSLQDSHSLLEESQKELNATITKLKDEIVEKDEKIAELDADVRDLKEMYRDQVESLITEIEHLKSSSR